MCIYLDLYPRHAHNATEVRGGRREHRQVCCVVRRMLMTGEHTCGDAIEQMVALSTSSPFYLLWKMRTRNGNEIYVIMNTRKLENKMMAFPSSGFFYFFIK